MRARLLPGEPCSADLRRTPRCRAPTALRRGDREPASDGALSVWLRRTSPAMRRNIFGPTAGIVFTAGAKRRSSRWRCAPTAPLRALLVPLACCAVRSGPDRGRVGRLHGDAGLATSPFETCGREVRQHGETSAGFPQMPGQRLSCCSIGRQHGEPGSMAGSLFSDEAGFGTTFARYFVAESARPGSGTSLMRNQAFAEKGDRLRKCPGPCLRWASGVGVIGRRGP